MKCVICGNLTEERNLCSECLGKKNHAKENIKISVWGAVICTIVLPVLIFIGAAFESSSFISKALVGASVCSVFGILGSIGSIVKHLFDYFYYKRMEREKTEQSIDESTEVNQEVLQRYFRNKNKS